MSELHSAEQTQEFEQKTLEGGVKRTTNNLHKNAPRKITLEVYHVMTLQDTTNLILCVTVVPKF